jgi:hypothetical protein
MKAYLVLVSVLAICPLAGCLSPEEQVRKDTASQSLESCLDSPEIRTCEGAISMPKYLSDEDLKLAKESLRQAEKEEDLRVERVMHGEAVVESIAAKVNYFQDNCQQTVISRNIFGKENIWETCVGDDLLSGLFGTWGRGVNTMFLSNEIWEDLDEKEIESLKEWLKDNAIRQIVVGRVIPSSRFTGNTITVDKTVWKSI